MENLIVALGEEAEHLNVLGFVPTRNEFAKSAVDGTLVVGVIVEQEWHCDCSQLRNITPLEAADHVGRTDGAGRDGSKGFVGANQCAPWKHAYFDVAVAHLFDALSPQIVAVTDRLCRRILVRERERDGLRQGGSSRNN